ncbi:MAG TPA: hypothetical protein VHL78_01670, partial [Actinomycetota bacterium]|nr:hypothetical protein [Actinomycetota bacterium]
MTIWVDAVPEDPQPFTYTRPGTEEPPFELDDDPADETLPNHMTFEGLAAGQHSFEQAAVDGWSLTDVACQGDEGVLIGTDEVFDAGDSLVVLTIDGGESIDCWFTNEPTGGKTSQRITSAQPGGPTILGPNGITGGDVSIDFEAAHPTSYDHTTGEGGGTHAGSVESLEGGDFQCGDHVIFLTHVAIDSGASGTGTIEIDHSFATKTTSGGLIGFVDVLEVEINADPANVLSGNESVSFTETNTANAVLATVQVSGLDHGEVIVLRLEVLLGCNAASATGNIHSEVTGARVVAPVQDTINVGNQTVPLKSAGEIRNAVLTIQKDAVPNSSTDFEFEPGGAFGTEPNFFLDDDNDATLPRFKDFAGLTPGQTYTVDEVSIPAGWSLTDITCTGQVSSTVTETATGVSVTPAPDEHITCTFTDSQAASSITIEKDAIPDSDQPFTFDPGGDFGAEPNFDLTDDATPGLPSKAFTNLSPGDYT